MEEVIDIRTLQCYQKATEEQRKKCTSKLSFEIGKLPTLKLQEEWTFYIKHCGEVKSLSSVRQETVYFKRVCEFMNHLKDEYSCAVTPQVRQTGNRLSGLAGTAYASLLA